MTHHWLIVTYCKPQCFFEGLFWPTSESRNLSQVQHHYRNRPLISQANACDCATRDSLTEINVQVQLSICIQFLHLIIMWMGRCKRSIQIFYTARCLLQSTHFFSSFLSNAFKLWKQKSHQRGHYPTIRLKGVIWEKCLIINNCHQQRHFSKSRHKAENLLFKKTRSKAQEMLFSKFYHFSKM